MVKKNNNNKEKEKKAGMSYSRLDFFNNGL